MSAQKKEVAQASYASEVFGVAEAQQRQASSASSAAASMFEGPPPSQGSCRDGTCGQGCAFQGQGCIKESKCIFCHVCPPQADAAQQLERREYHKAMRLFHKYRKKQKQLAQGNANNQSAASADGTEVRFPRANAQAACQTRTFLAHVDVPEERRFYTNAQAARQPFPYLEL